MYGRFGLLIDNAWTGAADGRTKPVHSPATGQKVGEIPAADLKDIEAFVRAQAGILFEPRRVKDHRFRSLAETSAIVNQRRQSA